MVLVDLIDDEPIPHQTRHDSKQRPRVRAEGTRLDQGHARPPAELGGPVDRVVEGGHRPECFESSVPRRPRSKSWK
jgi:hypothetical protein